MEKLEEEKKTQLDHNKLIRAWLESRKDAWFPSSKCNNFVVIWNSKANFEKSSYIVWCHFRLKKELNNFCYNTNKKVLFL